MSKEPIIETERLILRPITLDDAEACFSWNSDERVTKFMSYPTLTDISQTIDWIKSTLVDEREWNWAFVLKSENKIIGTGGIGPSDKMLGYWGIGYNLHYDYWHKGYCGNHCKYCFFTECDGCKSNNPSCSYANLFDDKKCPNVVCCESKNIDGCWQCENLDKCVVGFFSSGENDAKAYALYIKKYSPEKYTKRILELINKGYNYPRKFKDINDIEKILEMFEREE